MLRRTHTVTGRKSIITISHGRGGQGALRRNAGMVAMAAGLVLVVAITILLWA